MWCLRNHFVFAEEGPDCWGHCGGCCILTVQEVLPAVNSIQVSALLNISLLQWSNTKRRGKLWECDEFNKTKSQILIWRHCILHEDLGQNQISWIYGCRWQVVMMTGHGFLSIDPLAMDDSRHRAQLQGKVPPSVKEKLVVMVCFMDPLAGHQNAVSESRHQLRLWVKKIA